MSQEREEEQSGKMKVVDKRRFRFDDSGSLQEQPEAIERAAQEREARQKAEAAAKAAAPAPTQPAASPQQGQGPMAPAPDTAAVGGGQGPMAPQSNDAAQEAPSTSAQSPAREGMPVMDFIRQQAYLAMIYLGQQPNPATGLVQPQPEGCREIVDVLLMLRSVASANLTQEESFALDDLIRQLQMAYLQSTSAPPPPAPQG